MNEEQAAAVRDAVNGCPEIVSDEDVVDRADREPITTTRGGVTRTRTGNRTDPSDSRFRPAYSKQIGTVGNGEGDTRPVFVVILEPLWTERSTVRSLSPELVHEAAKHECRVRFYPPEHRLGESVWLVNTVFTMHPEASR